MTESVLVVGGGMSALAATWTLVQAGVRVDCVYSTAGETEQSSGAWDDQPWTQGLRSDFRESKNGSFLDALELFEAGVGGEPAVAATLEGVIRPTMAVGRGIMNAARFAGQQIGVIDIGRADFDASWLARSFSAQDWSRQTNTTFVPVAVPGIFEPREIELPLAAFSRILSDPARAQRAALQVEQLKLGSIVALLGGPWLGTKMFDATLTVSPVSSTRPWLETLHGPDGTFGARYVLARDALFSRLGVHHSRECVLGVRQEGEHVLAYATESNSPRRYRGAVLCQGGLLGGGAGFTSTRRGENQGWVLSGSTDSDLTGELCGWDPASSSKDWLYSVKGSVHAEGRVVRVQTGLAGAGTLGRAAQAGSMAAQKWISLHQ